jgi:hypothetical protein
MTTIRKRALTKAFNICSVAALVTASFPSGAVAAPRINQRPAVFYPILFNDHHVFAKPDALKAGRVLAALVRGKTILVPLRSMFEQMGGTVSYDAATKTVDVTKTGSDVKLTVGKPEVVLSGETRPLDVPPEIDGGILMVPVRVISEALGGYVQWVPEAKTVVVRYLAAPVPSAIPISSVPPTAPPTAAPAPPATAAPTPTPAPKRQAIQGYLASDALVDSKIYNELAPGVTGATSFDVKGALEVPFGPSGLMVGGDVRQYQYTHPANLGYVPCSAATGTCSTVVGGDPNYRGGPCPSADPGCVTVIGHGAYEAAVGAGQAYVPSFIARDRDYDVRVGLKLASPRVYVAASYLWRNFDYLGYPTQHGLGLGLEKLPDLDRPFSVYGNAYFYPTVSGTYTGPTSTYLGSLSGATFAWQYRVLKYEAGATYALGQSPFFVEAGFIGDAGSGKENAPANYTHSAIDLGAGLHF